MATLAGNLHLAARLVAIRAAVFPAWFSRTTAGRVSAFVPRFCLRLFSELFCVHLYLIVTAQVSDAVRVTGLPEWEIGYEFLGPVVTEVV